MALWSPHEGTDVALEVVNGEGLNAASERRQYDSDGFKNVALRLSHELGPVRVGGFGYYGLPTGDTSQTQYTALAYWEMLNHGIAPDEQAVQDCLKWLLRTQDPAGLWGYQGVDPGGDTLVTQTDRPGASMASFCVRCTNTSSRLACAGCNW